MGFLNNFFGGNEDLPQHEPTVNWVEFTNLIQLDEIETFSNQKRVLIFKHSTRCSISRMVLKQFENEFVSSENMILYFLDLIAHRAVSNQIAARFGVVHQSPQVLVIEKGKCIYNASHSDINAGVLVNL